MPAMPIDPAKARLVIEHKHDAPLMSCVFDPRGRFLFSGGRGPGVMCIEIATGEKTTLTGHDSWVGEMARAGSDLVLTGDYLGRVIAWDCSAEPPRERWNIDAHPSTIRALAVSADGETFATGDRDGIVRIWQTSDGRQLHELPKNVHPIYGLAFHPDGQRIVSADRQPQKPQIKVWDIATGRETLKIEVAELSGYRRVEDIEWGGIRGLTLSPDGSLIVACGRAGYDGPASALLFDSATGKLKRKLASSLKGFCYMARFHAQGFLMTVGGDVAKGEFRTWNVEQDASLADTSTSGPCTSLDIHPEGTRFAVTQAIGKSSYPETGLLAIYEWPA